MNPLYSPIFEERVSFLNDSQYWSKEKQQQYQLKRLKYLIKHVHQYVPYYRDFLNNNNLSVNDFNILDDIKKMPKINKSIVQENIEEFIDIRYSKDNLFHRTTGGSTGTPLSVYSDLDFFSRDKANTNYYMNVFGLDIFSHKSIRIYGDKVDATLIQEEKYWYQNDNKLLMSCYHIDETTASKYMQEINKFNPVYIHTRPSSILPLAKYILEQNLELKSPIRFIFSDGEYLTKGQRKIIERAFQGRLLNVYGHTEGCVFGHPCQYSDHLHFAPQVGLLELLDSDGNDVVNDNQKGELIVTGFNNLVFPLIRYETGDIGLYDSSSCLCGREYTIISKIEGRIQDYVVDINSNLIPLAPAIFNYNDIDWHGIKEFKVIQEDKGILRLLLLLEKSNTKPVVEVSSYFKTRLEQILGKSFSIIIEIVNDLSKTKIGKFRYLEQKLNIKEFFE